MHGIENLKTRKHSRSLIYWQSLYKELKKKNEMYRGG